MQAIHSIQIVSGPNLIIPVPPRISGKEVMIDVTPVADKPKSEMAEWEEVDPRS